MDDDDARDITWQPPEQETDQVRRYSVNQLLWLGSLLCFGGVVEIVRHVQHHEALLLPFGLFALGVVIVAIWAAMSRLQKQASDAAKPGGTR